MIIKFFSAMMSKFKQGFIILYMISIPFSVSSQDNKTIPPSPESTEFAKYINFEVSLFNGLPEIVIPLYTIKLRDISIPISLSYHASGIKFEQETGDAGLGWVVNPGYRISRTILGYADEVKQMPNDIITTLNTFENNALNQQGKTIRDQYLSEFVDGDQFNVSQDLDGQYDQFTLSLPNGGANFIISDRNTKTITTNEASNYKIDYKIGNSTASPEINGIIGFQVFDGHGIKYSYGEYNPQTSRTIEKLNNSSSPYSANTASAWGISEILAPNNEDVKFQYTTGTVGGIGCTEYLNILEGHQLNGLLLSNVTPTYIFKDFYSTFFTSTILTPYEKVVFTRLSDNRISSIQILTIDNEVIKTINFSYQSGVYLGYFTSSYYLLDSITISDNSGIPIEVYRFEYNKCPDYQSPYSSDQFGFCKCGNGAQGPQALYLHDNFKYDQIYLRDAINSGYFPISPTTLNTFMNDHFQEREEVQNVPNILSLKKIIYPTGGSTEYEYEKNNYSIYNPYGSETGTAGIRIRKITNYDPITDSSLTRVYKYGTNESGYGEAIFLVDHNSFAKESLHLDNRILANIGQGYLQRNISYSTEMQSELGVIAGNSSFVRYPQVAEYYSDSPHGNGKTVYFYDIVSPFQAGQLDKTNSIPLGIYTSTPKYITRYSQWDKPVLVKKDIFNKSLNKVSSEVYNYEKSFTSFYGLKVQTFADVYPDTHPVFPYYFQADNYTLQSYFDYGIYQFDVGKTELKSMLSYEFTNGDTIVSEHSYWYSNLLPSIETVKTSTGNTLINYTSYPLDYASGNSSIDDMKSNWLIDYPIEKVNCLENDGDHTIISGVITKFKSGGKGLLDSQWNTETAVPINSSNFKFSNRSSGIIPPAGFPSNFLQDTTYCKNITYDYYDSKGNILQFHKENDISTSYLWGYNQQYPVVKIVGIDYNSIPLSIRTNIANRDYTSSSNYSEVKDDVEFVKETMESLITNPAYALTICTYKPLVGLTSMTDSNGITTYYEYDTFGRLKIIKDNDGVILKAYEYHYKQ